MHTEKPILIYDPVCGMRLDLRINDIQAKYQDRRYYFCAESCKRKFLEDPANYIKPKGWWRRYLDRMGRINRKPFGSKRPGCCS